ncbi:MAG: MBL fold metallo-hydrolase [Gemmatimonadota bacterium]|nr:MBL fold metallo-hydrolase [Gemmatimonadota bacterium]
MKRHRVAAALAALGALAHPLSLRAQDSARVVVLGSGTPNADPDRSGPSVAIVINGVPYLVDAGPGVVRRAAGAQRNGIAALAAPNLAVVFITHLHSDHTLGLADLIFSPWTLGRTVPLKAFGPPGLRAMTEHLAAAYSADVQNRTTGLEPSNKTGWRVIGRDVKPGVVYHDSNVTVRAFVVPHANWAHAYGYRFETKGRNIVVSGDTRASDAVVNACNGCDVLVHEAWLESSIAKRTPDWQRYHHNAHTMATELGELASRAKPKLLLLYHLGPPGISDDAYIAEIRQHYSGPVMVAKDLGVY